MMMLNRKMTAAIQLLTVLFMVLALIGVSNTLQAQESGGDSGVTREMTREEHGNTLNYLVLAERLEQHFPDKGEDELAWEGQGWVGYDLHKLWFKTEGAYATEHSETEEIEVQALYSRAWTPLWDLQAGLRHNDYQSTTRTYAAIGMQGLAPQWFEMDIAAFVSDRGDVSARVEAEYELLLSQRLILQPRLELGVAFSEDPAIGSGSGLNDIDLGLRLRYEIRREFAPYIGINWEKLFGDTADMAEASGGADSDWSVMAGIRFWY